MSKVFPSVDLTLCVGQRQLPPSAAYVAFQVGRSSPHVPEGKLHDEQDVSKCGTIELHRPEKAAPLWLRATLLHRR